MSRTDEVAVAFIGAGSYAMGNLLPNMPKESWIKKKGVMTSSGLSGRTVAERFGFEFCTSDENEIFQNDSINTIFIATRHNTHSQYVIKALSSGKRVFIEKPLCLTEKEINDITELIGGQGTKGSMLMVGFNRRFSSLTKFIQEKLGHGPMSMMYRINAGVIPSDSWIQDKDIGGGRIVGEVCHFVDLLTYINGSLPEKVQAFVMPDPKCHQDTVSINMTFENGSIGTILYFANGPKNLPKEYLEVYRAGATAILKDFKEVDILSSGKKMTKRLIFQDKGQAAMVRTFLEAVKSGYRSPIPFEEIAAVTLTTLKIEESLRTVAIVPVGGRA